MSTSENNIKYLEQLFVSELHSLYEPNELRNIFFLSVEALFGFTKTELTTKRETELDKEKSEKLRNIAFELKKEIPIQYILGNTEFYGLDLKVNSSVLIPRSETEELVHWILKENNADHLKVLDIGTGSGCIPISLKKNRPNWDITAIDISENALNLARENAKTNKTEINFLKADVLQELKLDSYFDIIVSNPPYILNSEASLMKRNVLDNEPDIALVVPDNNPLIFYVTIINESEKLRKGDLKIYFEINEFQTQNLKNILEKKDIQNFNFRKDLNGKQRMLKIEIN